MLFTEKDIDIVEVLKSFGPKKCRERGGGHRKYLLTRVKPPSSVCCPFNAVPAKEAARLEKMSSQRSGSARATTLAELKLQQRLLKDQLKTTETSLEKARTLILKKKINKMVVSEAAEVSMNHDRRIGGVGRALVNQAAMPTFFNRRVPGAQATSPTGKLSSLRVKQLQRQLKESSDHERQRLARPRPGPGKAGAYRRQPLPVAMFPIRYARGELPCTVDHVSSGLALSWVAPLQHLDFEVYLPIFVEGLVCTQHPYAFIVSLVIPQHHQTSMRPVHQS